MKKTTGLLIVFSLLLFVYICIPQLSDAQKLAPGVKDIKKPGISKSTVKKKGLSNFVKSKLPALEVSRLALGPGCKITGFLQNKGGKFDASHPDFNKLEIKVGYTFNGKTEEVILKRNAGSSSDQPYLLISVPDMVNFINGRPAKFTSKLKIPPTGKGFATVFAEIDPANKIRETPSGEQRKRIEKRLRSRCAPKPRPAMSLNLPKKAKKITIGSDAKKKVNIPVSNSFDADKMVTKSTTNINFSKPSNGQVFNQGDSIPVEFSYASHTRGVILLKYVIYANDKQTGQRVNTYYPPEIRIKESLNPSGGSFEIDSNMIQEENVSDFFYQILLNAHHSTLGISATGLSSPFNFSATEMGPPVNPVVMALMQNQYFNPAPTSDGLSIAVSEMERGFCTDAEVIDFHYITEIENIDDRDEVSFWLTPAAGDGRQAFAGSYDMRVIREDDGELHLRPASEDIRPGFYRIFGMIRDYGGVVLGTGSSVAFELKNCVVTGDGGGAVFFPPISDGIQIIEPAGDEIFYNGADLNIRYIVDILVPDGATIRFTIEDNSPPHNVVANGTGHIQLDGTAELPLSRISYGIYRLRATIKDLSGNTLATATSGVFRIEMSARTPSGGIEITSPTAADWYRSTDQIIVRYDFRSCEEAMTGGVTINLHHYFELEHGSMHRPYELFQGIPLTASGTMSFDIPPEEVSAEPTGFHGYYYIEIRGDQSGGLPMDCWAFSESFRVSR